MLCIANRAAPKNKSTIEQYAAEGRIKAKLGSQVIAFDEQTVTLALADALTLEAALTIDVATSPGGGVLRPHEITRPVADATATIATCRGRSLIVGEALPARVERCNARARSGSKSGLNRTARPPP